MTMGAVAGVGRIEAEENNLVGGSFIRCGNCDGMMMRMCEVARVRLRCVCMCVADYLADSHCEAGVERLPNVVCGLARLWILGHDGTVYCRTRQAHWCWV